MCFHLLRMSNNISLFKKIKIFNKEKKMFFYNSICTKSTGINGNFFICSSRTCCYTRCQILTHNFATIISTNIAFICCSIKYLSSLLIKLFDKKKILRKLQHILELDYYLIYIQLHKLNN